LNDWLRLMMASNRARPASPSASAASVGGTSAAAAPIASCAPTTGRNCGSQAMSRQAAAIISPETAAISRFIRVASTSSPAGTWQIAAEIELAAIANPIRPGCQCWPARNTVK